MQKKISSEELVAFLKHLGFVYQGSEIYGGLANSWDYGPLGAELKRNIKEFWWKKFIREVPLNTGLDAGILMNTQVWQASGHIANFSDPLIDCKSCKARYRADDLIKDATGISADGWSNEKMYAYIKENNIKCPNCGESNFTDVRAFNLMFKTNQGVIDDAKNTIYLRPETAQGIFVNFKNVSRTTRKKLPFGIGQIGKSFRNEITPGNFIFRTREFEQMELEFFCKPGTDLDWYRYWKDYCWKFLLQCGIREELLRFREHEKEELSFYSKATVDIEFLYAFGWAELWGIADRSDYDLKVHMDKSGTSLEYFDSETNTKYLPYVVEPSVGVERLLLAIVTSAYDEEIFPSGEKRIVLRLPKKLAPVKVAVLPLVNKLTDKAREVLSLLNKHFVCEFDASGNIGRRYRRQDQIGTPYCITIDFQTLTDADVTVRERDSMEQVRIKLTDLADYLALNLNDGDFNG